jgi:menaquinone-dependent protoporphyrinogen oxidase
MSDKILVAYATKYGATAEIAEKIGEALSQAGLETDVVLVHHVTDVQSYTAVVLGSAVYIGQWRREASGFLKANEKPLAKIPVWLFSSGPTGNGDPLELMQGWIFPKALKPIADRIKPRGMVLFHGALDADKIGFVEKWMVNNVKAPFGDFRNWDVITSWAKGIADTLKKEGWA